MLGSFPCCTRLLVLKHIRNRNQTFVSCWSWCHIVSPSCERNYATRIYHKNNIYFANIFYINGSKRLLLTPGTNRLKAFSLHSTKTSSKRLLSLAKPEKWNLFAGVSLLLISSTVSMAVPFCIGKVIDLITSLSGAELQQQLMTLSEILLGVFLLGGAANAGRVYLMNMASQRIVNNLRKTVYSSLLQQEIGFFDKSKTGELINRLSADTTVAGTCLTTNVSDGLRSVFATIAGTSMMVYTCPQLALIGLATVPPVALLAIIYGRYVRKISKSVQDSLAQATQVAEEHIANIRTVRSFAQEDLEMKSYDKKIQHVLALAKNESLARAVFFGMSGFSGNVIVLVVLYSGGTMMSESLLTIGQLSSFLMYAGYVGVSIGGLSSFYSEFMRAIGASSRLWELLDREPQIPLHGGLTLPEICGEVVFNSVTFAYPNRPDSLVFRDLSLSIPPGSVTAVVGGSGSGKSTLASLLLRLYDTNAGCILLDGQDIRTLNPSWFRKHVGVVSQDPVLFSCSIRDNILYGALEPESVTEERIIQVLKDANAWEFVSNCPSGLDTLVGERGVMLSVLSSDERMMVPSLIRQMKLFLNVLKPELQDPRILILDEATSALDTQSEKLVQEALEVLMRGRTVITIAHRLSTIVNANQIAVMNLGKIAELGRYDELMKRPNGIFWQLVKQQTILH